MWTFYKSPTVRKVALPVSLATAGIAGYVFLMSFCVGTCCELVSGSNYPCDARLAPTMKWLFASSIPVLFGSVFVATGARAVEDIL